MTPIHHPRPCEYCIQTQNGAEMSCRLIITTLSMSEISRPVHTQNSRRRSKFFFTEIEIGRRRKPRGSFTTPNCVRWQYPRVKPNLQLQGQRSKSKKLVVMTVLDISTQSVLKMAFSPPYLSLQSFILSTIFSKRKSQTKIWCCSDNFVQCLIIYDELFQVYF